MKQELQAVEKNKTWELTDLLADHRSITLKWVFKMKKDEKGAVTKHKARLVARGFVQQEGVDYDDAFASVTRMESVRVFLALAAQEGWWVHHMDVKFVLLNGDLKEEVYVCQPPGFAVARKTRCTACARPSTARGRHRVPGTQSWTPHSRRWASTRARTRRQCTSKAVGALSCSSVSTSMISSSPASRKKW
jgi:hypothetical protein